ncbi:hypothetical protein [Delftia phage IME-DE1]|uniref:Uncharacterized protein n=1 Tax=Delftia phage IME-DE1 TaxID=1647385 RepID=A0A0F7ILR1_9CAUD|nr:hypothetical protein AU155_gp42 [Delftia phage IME-DE1]AKG94505.1 hypothetical protein [Delftia phage IME-DE1]
MGGIVRSVKKAVGGLLGTNKAPEIIMPDPVVQAVAAPAEQAQAPVSETEQGLTNEKANRKGKSALRVQRSNVGGGSGLNM